MKHFLSLVLLTMIPVASVAQPSSWLLITQHDRDFIERACTEYIGVPYGTDNISDLDWLRWEDCRETMADNLVHNSPVIRR